MKKGQTLQARRPRKFLLVIKSAKKKLGALLQKKEKKQIKKGKKTKTRHAGSTESLPINGCILEKPRTQVAKNDLRKIGDNKTVSSKT